MSDIPIPTKPRNSDPLQGARESDRLSPGAFFAQHKAVVDARRHHLDRLGMDARHVQALRKPDLAEAPLHVMGNPAVEPVHADTPHVHREEPDAAHIPQAYSPKRPPNLADLRGDVAP